VLWRKAVTPAKQVHRDGGIITITPKRGTDGAYLLTRVLLPKDDIKYLSATAAAVEAGIRKKPTALDDLNRAWKRGHGRTAGSLYGGSLSVYIHLVKICGTAVPSNPGAEARARRAVPETRQDGRGRTDLVKRGDRRKRRKTHNPRQERPPDGRRGEAHVKLV